MPYINDLGLVARPADGGWRFDAIVAGSLGRGRARHLWLAQFTAELAPVWRIDESGDEVTDARGLARDGDGGLVVVGVRLPGDGTPPGTWLRRYLPGVPP